eukprot:489530_1
MSTTLLLIVASSVICVVLGRTYTESEWQEAKDDLIKAKASFGLTDYVYNLQASCYCQQCYVAKKYIVIEDGTPTYVEFDAAALTASCPASEHIQSPLSDSFYDISYYYDRAIAHAQSGLDADCVNSMDMICNGGSLTFTYDPTYFYPTTISLAFGNMVADAGISWTFSCLSPLSDTSACPDFTMPNEGDSCGKSGIDCPGMKCACASCPDGSGKSYGCCGCTLVENTKGELLCSAYTPQDVICPVVAPCICTLEYDPFCCEGTVYGNGCQAGCEGFTVDTDCSAGTCDTVSKCGGFAGFQCEKGLYCVDDPTDDCDATKGGADCMGICVSAGDSCESSPDCSGLQPLCACALCADGSGNSYGCCGCKWQLNDAGDGLVCGAITSQDDVCPVVAPCICTLQYDPFCCEGTVYGNACQAGCEGFTVDTDCTAGACPVPTTTTTALPTQAPQECLAVSSSKTDAINGIYKKRKRKVDGVVSYVNVQKARSKKARIKLYRYGNVWMFDTSTGNGNSITDCDPGTDDATAFLRCNPWTSDEDLEILYSSCNAAAAFEMDEGNTSNNISAATSYVVGGILVALMIGFGVFMWCRCKKRKGILKEIVMDEEQDEYHEGEDLSELDVV